MSNLIKEKFAQEGYVVINNLFSIQEAQAYNEECKRILETKDVGKSGVLVGLSILSPLFKEAAAHPRLVASLKEIIGDHVIFLSDKVVFKNAATDFGSPWHQDYPYWKGSHKYSVWIALDEATPSNGCLRIVPGSHLQGFVSHGAEATDGNGFVNRIRTEDLDSSKIIDLEASQGDAIIFHDLLFHASYPNVSGKDRWALISTYKDGTQEDPEYEWAGAAFSV
ncbi:phytanoyl-CoA dioxygenase family protein [Cohnella silvisoli]|uniref:Phytanoyl-CoA dioxygenase family protein n=1 Tax=Cohnella silvisoli TaxID=2873699 RepID=A0ABV1L1G5_9BACL|nr:phytanoyl-CoA dioxygenase family protein [Cohnella silvisoli]MCD9024923.1 phytanoyl-CoA dioxygenase family protein [Cohnella silvisoli]